MISIPVLELAICAKLKLIVNKAMYLPSCPLGALLSANEFEKGKINISPKVINNILIIKMPDHGLYNKTKKLRDIRREPQSKI